MSCYHPLKAFRIGIWPESGKPKYKICSYAIDHLEDGRPCASSFVSPYASKVEREYITIPCGKCIGCRLDYAREWANRCMLELKYHDKAWFLTLTYDDEHIHYMMFDGVVVQTLWKKDLQDFFKRLRKGNKERGLKPQKVRYYACGEYGGRTRRPHYHAIVFGLDIAEEDLRLYKVSPQGYKYFVCDWITDVWQKGYVVLGEVNWNTCAYTARYMMKKLKGVDEYGNPWKMYYDSIGIEPEFVTMSRKPGIAYQEFESNKRQIYDFDKILISKDDEVLEVKPPRYYDRLFDLEDPDLLALNKERRKHIADSKVREAEKSSGKRYDIYMKDCEELKKRKIRALKRRLENGEA